MAPPLPPWLDADLLDASGPPDFEALVGMGRVLLTTAPKHRALRREVRALLDAALHAHGVAPLARHWEGRLDVLRALHDQTLVEGAPVDRYNVAALLQGRHALHAARAVLLRTALTIPTLPGATLARAATSASSLDHVLARFDGELEPWQPALRVTLLRPPTDPQEVLWTTELLDARAPGSNPWWIDVANPLLAPLPIWAPAPIGLGATLEPGREYASWTFERGWRLVLFADARGALVASLRNLPPDVDGSGLWLSWIDDITTRRAAFALDEWGDVSAHPEASILASEVVALREGDRFLHRRAEEEP